MNAIDLIILLVLALYAFHGWRRGFLLLALDLVAFLFALVFPLLFSRYGIDILDRLGMSPGLAFAGSFMLIFVAAQLAFWLILRSVYALIPKAIKGSAFNRLMGLLPSLAKGYVICSLVLMLIVVLPLHVPQELAEQSLLGSGMLRVASAIREAAAPVLSGAIEEGLHFLTVQPNTDKRVKIAVSTEGLLVDAQSEREMLGMINRQRMAAGLKRLRSDSDLRELARAQSRDMFARGYFGHVNPDGNDPFDRMREAGINYREAGENLAMAPTVAIAHQGLMKSPGHRANILDPKFGRVGIGVISNGVRGRMFSQEFAD